MAIGEPKGDFLPDLCKVQSVFTLIIAGELLALALVLAKSGLHPFNWQSLGTVSFLVQWIVLPSAALLCPLRPFLSKQPLVMAGFISYMVVLIVGFLVSVAGQLLVSQGAIDWWGVGNTMLLTGIFAGIVLRYFYIQQQLLRREEAELQARIQALQSRIRPHFLFNCMNSIVSLIGSDPDRAERVVVDLADLFRASLAEPGKVPIKTELALCRQYIEIEQLRLGNRLTMDWQVDEEAYENVTIPSMLLQPIIENAIYHGIQPRAQGGTVEIFVKASDNRLKVVVRNPLATKRDEAPKPGNRVAMDNIRRRLIAYYDNTAEFTAGEEGDKFVTMISYPLNA